MERINNILLITLLAFVFSCTAKKQISQVPVHTTTKIVERMIPIAMPQDSSTLLALFECDSNNKVILEQLHEAKTSRLNSSYNLHNGVFSYKISTIHDTIYVTARDTIITKEKPIQLPQTVSKTQKIQHVLMGIGIAFLAIALLGGIRLFIK